MSLNVIFRGNNQVWPFFWDLTWMGRHGAVPFRRPREGDVELMSIYEEMTKRLLDEHNPSP